MSGRSDVRVLLLRGVNVGGRNRLPMEALRGLLEELGCERVQSWIQSGNVVCMAEDRLAATLAERLAGELEERHGVTTPVVLRDGAELHRIIERNPFVGPEVEPKSLHVAFLAERPEPERVAALDPERSPGDEFTVVGSEIYLHLPEGMARTKLTNAWFDRALGTVSTVRNWRTTLKLREMAASAGADET